MLGPNVIVAKIARLIQSQLEKRFKLWGKSDFPAYRTVSPTGNQLDFLPGHSRCNPQFRKNPSAHPLRLANQG